MSMRDYPVFDYGLVLTTNEFLDLLKTYNGTDIDLKEELNEIVENEDYCAIDDLVYGELSEFDRISSFDGEFKNLKENNEINFNDDDIYVLGLAKFNIYNNSALYTSYNNEEEIYKEVKETLKRLGFDVTDDYIIKNTGKIWGTYFG